MAITRAQIPEQVDIFNQGGGANSDEYNNLIQQMTSSDYDASFQKYFDRLSQVSPPRRKMNIYEVASELGAGLLYTPNTGVGSAYKGLGVGFTRISDRLRAAAEEDRKYNQTLGLQAAQMAMQDEAKALQFLRDASMEQLKYRNKRGDLITFEKVGQDGKVKTVTVRDNAANDTIINGYLKDGYTERSGAQTIKVQTGPTYSKRDEEAIKRQNKNEEEISEKLRAANASLASLSEAKVIANKLGPTNFGTVAKFTLFPRQILEGFGVTNDNKQDVLGDQILLSQISLGFTMDIVSRTKGAISNREMEMFERASPGLGSNYNGFIKQVEYLERIAQRDRDFGAAYFQKADELEDQEAQGLISASKVVRELEKFEADWYEDNLIFTDEEFDELEKIASGDYTDAGGNQYTIPEDFDAGKWQKSYRKGQAQADNNPSTYTKLKPPVVDSLERLLAQTEAKQVTSTFTEDDKNKAIAAITEKLEKARKAAGIQ
jgi:hypothetical protein